MKAPGKPDNEQMRLATLRSLNILDSTPEERFDRLTRLARRLFDVPIALVSLIDADRQWFKSVAGLNAKETSREVSFCAHAILDENILTVPDAVHDERFRDNPLVIGEPHIRFYAGCPLLASNGSKLGTLCLIDRQPREFNEDDHALLRDLAAMVEQELAVIQLAITDELTLLANRRGFEALAQQALRVCKRLNKPGCLLFFDLNEFKQVNDRFGHAEGDQALIAFSKLLLEVFRDSDIIGRLSGDEFVVFLANATASVSNEILHRLNQTVHTYNREAGREYQLSYCVGVAEFDPDRHENISDLLKDADTVLYQQKRSLDTFWFDPE